jgi:antitoxin component YwqK of YwqJK toxin-antitoxin module
MCLTLIFTSIATSGQTANTKKTEHISSIGREEFFICTNGCSVNYDNSIEYYWYNEYSGVKSTIGGNGGSLLNGVYKYFDTKGNLLQERNFKMGVLHGKEKNWDDKGNITGESKYENGSAVYFKTKLEDGGWLEFDGPMFETGSTRKFYTSFMKLIQVTTWLHFDEVQIKNYYSNGQLEEEYTTSFLFQDNRKGKYNSYYENGKPHVIGQYYDKDFLGLRDGEWKWYKPDGTLESTELYMVDIEYWENGEYKTLGSRLWSEKHKVFMYTGVWKTYDETGKKIKEMDWR